MQLPTLSLACPESQRDFSYKGISSQQLHEQEDQGGVLRVIQTSSEFKELHQAILRPWDALTGTRRKLPSAELGLWPIVASSGQLGLSSLISLPTSPGLLHAQQILYQEFLAYPKIQISKN